MNLRLHHTNESGCAPAIAAESPVTEESLSQPSPNIPAFSGRLTFDITTGLQDNFHRWYDPTPGQWLSEDPIGFDASDENLTRYVGQ